MPGKIFFIIDKIDAWIGRLFTLLTYRGIGLVVLIVIYFIGLLSVTSFSTILREDSYVYTLTALEILNGNFLPPPATQIGWPLLLAAFFGFLQINDLFTAMLAARCLSFAFVAGVFLLMYGICRKCVAAYNKYQIAAVVAICTFMSTESSVNMTGSAMTEPAFIFFTLSSIYFLVDDQTTIKNVMLAAIFASLSYYVRLNGIFSIGIIAIFLLTRPELTKTLKAKYILVAILVFFMISAPHMIQRLQAYGSVFSFGLNSKIFLSYPTGGGFATPTLVEYANMSSFADLYQRFISLGLWRVLVDVYSSALPKIWVFIFIAGFLQTVLIIRDKKYDIFYLWAVLSMLGIALVFHVFRADRHLIYLVPIILIASVGFVSAADRNTPIKFSNVILFIMLLFNLSWLPRVMSPVSVEQFAIPAVHDEWAVWGARHLEGNVAIVEGGDLLRMAQHYGDFSPEDKTVLPFNGVEKTIETMRPGRYLKLQDALAEFKALEIRYVILDDKYIRMRPYLAQLRKSEWRKKFPHLKYFPGGTEGSLLRGINIYEVRLD